MKLRLLAAGTRLPQWVNDAYSHYAQRIGADLKCELLEIPVAARGPNADIARAMAREGEAMLRVVRPDDFVVALDVVGTTMNTEELARWLGTRMQEGRDLSFLIGGPDGLAPACRARADLRLSFSALTFPHGLVRVLLAEQLYRALSLIRGHPYHRG
ncbi:MAG: 23S rRNA (pseudouridine(1915)-N(3))-methyltransferase RlmH [Steroidobacterales bacterium]